MTIHKRNIDVLMVEIFRVTNKICPPIIKSLSIFRELFSYNIRNVQDIKTQGVKTINFDLEAKIYLRSTAQPISFNEEKSFSNITDFKTKIKNWKCNECPCRFAKSLL